MKIFGIKIFGKKHSNYNQRDNLWFMWLTNSGWSSTCPHCGALLIKNGHTHQQKIFENGKTRIITKQSCAICGNIVRNTNGAEEIITLKNLKETVALKQ